MNPSISVVVSTRDRSQRLSGLLESLRAQTLGSEQFEVVVVDDGSRDETASVLEREVERGGLRLRSLSLDSSLGPGGARNEGWRAANGSLIVFTDDDCAADPGWLEALQAAAASEPPGCLVQGRTDPMPEEKDSIGPFSRTLEVTHLGPFFQTCNMAYPRAMLEALDGFDDSTFPQSGEDTDLAWRAIEAGAEVVYAENARVFHAVNQFGPLGSLRFPLRWSDAMGNLARHPELRSELHRGVFWKRSHELLLVALVGAGAARKFPLAGLLTLPYTRDVMRRARRRGSSASYAPHLALQDLVETYATIRGAVRSRTLVL